MRGDRIEAHYRRSQCTYGRPRIQADLRDAQIYVSDRRVARLRRERNLQGVSRRNAFTATMRDKAARQASDLVKRQFTAAAPNQLWVADFTYVPTMAGFLFLAVVLDVLGRRVVGWAIETHMSDEEVSRLQMGYFACMKIRVHENSTWRYQGKMVTKKNTSQLDLQGVIGRKTMMLGAYVSG